MNQHSRLKQNQERAHSSLRSNSSEGTANNSNRSNKCEVQQSQQSIPLTQPSPRESLQAWREEGGQAQSVHYDPNQQRHAASMQAAGQHLGQEQHLIPETEEEKDDEETQDGEARGQGGKGKQNGGPHGVNKARELSELCPKTWGGRQAAL